MSGAANHQRLTPFEHYMLADDRADYPMDFFLRFGFSDRLDSVRLAEALADVSPGHPLFNATVCRDGGRWVWNANCVSPQLVPCADTLGTGTPVFPAIDPSRECGFRAWLDSCGERDDLWLQVHHSCADAVGVLLFCRQWLRRYEELHGGKDRPASRASELEQQGTNTWAQRFARPHLSPWRYLVPQRQERHRLLSFAMNRPRRILLPEPAAPQRRETVARPAVAHASLELTREIWKSAKQRLQTEASLNDLLLAGLFCALRQWNDEISGGRDKYCLRIAMPMDLRAETGQTAAAMNNVSIVFLDRAAKDIQTSPEFLAGIHQETSWIKKNHGAFVLHDVLRMLQPLPGGMKSLVAPVGCTATAVLSNLGELASFLPHEHHLQLDDAQLVDLDFLPPIRPGTLAALGVATYAGRLHISLRYDAPRMSSVIAEKLLGRIAAQWSGFLVSGD